MLSKSYYVYIMTNESDTLYTGVTNDPTKRVYQHKNKLLPGFTTKYNITRLVYFEETTMFKQRWRERSRSKDG
jgi:putative endonuclease